MQPLQPGILLIAVVTTHHEATRLYMEHVDQVRVFRKTVKLEKFLMNLTCKALDETFYKEQINPHTNMITDDLSVFSSWLFSTYGDINSNILGEEAKKVLELSYDL